MYRIIQCDKDTYITNKIIKQSRSLDANTGQAGTLDLYKLYDETYLPGSSEVYEQTRILVHFNFNPLRELTGSNLNLNNMKCYLNFTNIYHGQPVPSNFTISINPLARTFDEGRGFDVISYQDKDSANWLTASFSTGAPSLWALSGANLGGGLGTPNIDYYLSGVLSSGSVPLERTFTFSRGDEDFIVDITTFVSATLAGIIPDYGFRIALTQSQDLNQNTYFVKRFNSRHVKNPFKRPKILVLQDDTFIDNQLDAYTDISNNFGIYNKVFGQYRNFYSGSVEITGSNSLLLNLIASRSLTVWTSSFSQTHNQSINHLTSSTIYYCVSFSGSQLTLNNLNVKGAYFANVNIDSNNINWINFVNARDWRNDGKITDVSFSTEWKSLDGNLLYSSGSGILMKLLSANSNNVFERNFVTNVTNLKQIYNTQEVIRMRVFIQDYNTELKYGKLPSELISTIYNNMHWRLINFYTREIVIPFGEANSTKLSSDGNGMYFDMYMQDLPVDQIYEFEFKITEGGKDYFITNQGFKFKVVS